MIVGLSRGGLVATAIAERHPALVRHLILLCSPSLQASRVSLSRPLEHALAVRGVGDLLWAVAPESRQRVGLQTAFAPGFPVPDQFVTDLHGGGRTNLVRSTRAIDDYLRTRSLPDRLVDLVVPPGGRAR